jgi:hypothetical protein
MSRLLVPFFLAIGSAAAYGLSPDVFADRDATVLTVALADFEKLPEAHDFAPPGFVAVPSESRTLRPGVASPHDIPAAAALTTKAPLVALENYLTRNRHSILLRLSASAPTSLHLEPSNSQSCKSAIDRGPGVRTCAYARAPGYSADGTWAFVGFDFLWSMHSGTAAYLLKNSSGTWTVVAKNFDIYL